MKIRPLGAAFHLGGRADGRSYGHDEANCPFSQFAHAPKNTSAYGSVHFYIECVQYCEAQYLPTNCIQEP
jgi:hypothetical protein